MSTSWTIPAALLAAGGLLLTACDGGKGGAADADATPAEATTPPPPGKTDTLYLAQAYFVYEPDPETGKSRPKPGPAKLTMVRGTGEGWETEILEDPESNVFHKAMVVDLDDGRGEVLLTIGANAARLKTWTRTDGTWSSTTHWAPTFGGKQERLREVEVGDVTGDGRADVVVATHDKGVVAVIEVPADGSAWVVHEVDRTEERTFVHEIEIGDVDGDGKVEFFATPSAPNVLDGTPQPGHIAGYRWTGDGAERFDVATFSGAHVKEILVADLEGRGHPDLFASIEPERVKGAGGDYTVEDPLIIRRYRWTDDGVEELDVATFRDEQCRFLTAGDLTGDGKPEMIASTMSTGVWMLSPGSDGFTVAQVAADSTMDYEHAAAILDLDGDGRNELYVAADDNPTVEGALSRYTWNGHSFDAQTVIAIPTDHMTFNITAD